MSSKPAFLAGVANLSFLLVLSGIARGAPPQPDAPQANAGAQLEEVVVTAQKRSEKLQNVPVAVNAFSAAALKQSGIETVADLNKVTSSLNITTASGTLLPFLRGVGSNYQQAGNEAAVAVYVDDVYVARLEQAFFQLSNIDRVEVLEGPQGTLFGRNASGGVINIYTKNPSQRFEVDASAGYDNYDTTTEKIYVGGGITDNLAADISAFHDNQGRSWGRNLYTHAPWGYDDATELRSKWILDIDDATSLRVTADYIHSKSTAGIVGNNVQGTATGTQLFYTLPPYNRPIVKYPAVGFYDENIDTNEYNATEGWGSSARLEHDFDFAKFSSITGYRQSHELFLAEGDYTPDPSTNYLLDQYYRTFSQEFQISSEKDSPFDWVAGLYYLNAYAGYQPTAVRGQGLAPNILGGAAGNVLPDGSTLNLFGAQRIQDYATYGQATFHVFPDTNLTVGARYTYDDVKGFGNTTLIIPGVNPINFGSEKEETHFYKPTFKVALDHHFTEDIMGYVSFSRGFTAGTYNTLPLSAKAVAPEVLDDYEIGVKSTLLDKRLQLNGAFFYYNLSNPQVEEIVSGLVNFANAGSAEIKGVDLQAQYLATEGLVARFGAEYLDAHYTQFLNAPFILPNPNPPYGTFPTRPGNATGAQLPRVPRFTFNVGANYDLPTSVGDFNADINFAFNGGFKWDPDGYLRQHAYGVLDASVTYMLPDDDRWRFRLWGKNLTQAHYYAQTEENSGPQGYNASPAAPATFGLTIEFKFTEEEPVPAGTNTYTPPAAATIVTVPTSYLVFFDFNKSDLTEQAGAIVDQAAKNTKLAKDTRLTVTGHTDTVGSDAYNMRLSRRRAESVAARLEKDGVSANEIEIVAKGKRDLLVPTGDGVREPQNRRVQIVYSGDASS